jgi:hypothetical protein
VLHYNLKSLKVIQNYKNLQIGPIFSGILFGNFAVFGGLKYLRVICLTSKKVFGNNIETAIRKIYSIRCFTLRNKTNQNNQIILTVSGKKSMKIKDKTDTFEITKLTQYFGKQTPMEINTISDDEPTFKRDIQINKLTKEIQLRAVKQLNQKRKSLTIEKSNFTDLLKRKEQMTLDEDSNNYINNKEMFKFEDNLDRIGSLERMEIMKLKLKLNEQKTKVKSLKEKLAEMKQKKLELESTLKIKIIQMEETFSKVREHLEQQLKVKRRKIKSLTNEMNLKIQFFEKEKIKQQKIQQKLYEENNKLNEKIIEFKLLSNSRADEKVNSLMDTVEGIFERQGYTI